MSVSLRNLLFALQQEIIDKSALSDGSAGMPPALVRDSHAMKLRLPSVTPIISATACLTADPMGVDLFDCQLFDRGEGARQLVERRAGQGHGDR